MGYKGLGLSKSASKLGVRMKNLKLRKSEIREDVKQNDRKNLIVFLITISLSIYKYLFFDLESLILSISLNIHNMFYT